MGSRCQRDKQSLISFSTPATCTTLSSKWCKEERYQISHQSFCRYGDTEQPVFTSETTVVLSEWIIKHFRGNFSCPNVTSF